MQIEIDKLREIIRQHIQSGRRFVQFRQSVIKKCK